MVHSEAFGGQDVAQELHGVLVEVVLFQLHIQAMLAEPFQDQPDVLNVLLGILGKYEDIIWVDYNVLLYAVMEALVHGALEWWWNVHEAKQRYRILIMATPSLNSCLILISWSDTSQVVGYVFSAHRGQC